MTFSLSFSFHTETNVEMANITKGEKQIHVKLCNSLLNITDMIYPTEVERVATCPFATEQLTTLLAV